MSIRQWICEHICSVCYELLDELSAVLRQKVAGLIPDPPSKEDYISRDEAYALIKRQLPVEGGSILVLGAPRYYLIDDKDVASFLKADTTDLIPYMEDYVCRNFAFRLFGQFQVPGWDDFAVFIVWGGGHAVLAFCDKAKRLKYIEPQNDKIFLPSSARGKKIAPIGFLVG